MASDIIKETNTDMSAQLYENYENIERSDFIDAQSKKQIVDYLEKITGEDQDAVNEMLNSGSFDVPTQVDVINDAQSDNKTAQLVCMWVIFPSIIKMYKQYLHATGGDADKFDYLSRCYEILVSNSSITDENPISVIDRIDTFKTQAPFATLQDWFKKCANNVLIQVSIDQRKRGITGRGSSADYGRKIGHVGSIDDRTSDDGEGTLGDKLASDYLNPEEEMEFGVDARIQKFKELIQDDELYNGRNPAPVDVLLYWIWAHKTGTEIKTKDFLEEFRTSTDAPINPPHARKRFEVIVGVFEMYDMSVPEFTKDIDLLGGDFAEAMIRKECRKHGYEDYWSRAEDIVIG